MYRAGKHNAADAFNKQLNYASEVEENSCLFTLQSKLKAMKTITSESLEPLKRKPNEADCVRHINDVSASVRHKPTIREKFKMNWHKLPESSMKELNEADHTEHINSMTTLMRHKLAIQDVTHHLKKECTPSSNVGPLTFLPRRVIVAATAMKKAHKKPAPALMNLIQEAQLQDAHILKIGIALDSGHLLKCKEAS